MTSPELLLSAQQITSTTRVIVSFGARDGGFELTAQLRLDIMERYGKRRVIRTPDGRFLRLEADESFCYLDAVTLKQAPGTSYDRLQLDKAVAGTPAGGAKQKVAIDLNKMANPFWDTYYPQAVANAAVMVFQITTPWLESPFCLEEMGWFIVQSLRNVALGRPLACVFMVFDEAKDAFKTLLGQLRLGLTTKQPTQCIVGYPYERMLKGFASLDGPFLDAARNPAALALQRSQFNALLTAMTERCIDVPPGFGAIGFTDYYDAQEQRIKLGANGAAPPQAAYDHRFNFNYGITETFKNKLFELLDADLAKSGIVPVPS
jgi:hypothetical protein